MAAMQLNPVYVAIAVIFAGCIVRFFIKAYELRKFFRDKPGPPHSWVWGHLPVFSTIFQHVPRDSHPHSYAYHVSTIYNLPRFYYMDLWPVFERNLVITDPAIAQQVTVTKSLKKHPILKKFIRPIAGKENILSADGEQWRRWRAVFNPGFSAAHLMTLVPMIVEHTETFVEVLGGMADKGVIFRLEEAATRYTVDIIGRVVLNAKLNAQVSDHPLLTAFRKQINWLPRAQATQLSWYNPIRMYHLWKNGRAMDQYLEAELDKRFESQDMEASKDKKARKRYIIDLALQTYLEEEGGKKGEGLDNEFKRNAISQIKSFIFAGHDTTSSTIAYACHILSKHPSVVAKLCSEHDALFGPDVSGTADLLREDPYLINKLSYTTAVIKETLRLFPPASSVRVGEEGVEIVDPLTGEKYPTKGCLVWVTLEAMHRLPCLWERADEFVPERWLSQESTPPAQEKGLPPQPPANAWRPFEKGPRGCMGQELAMIEMKVALAMTVRRFKFQAVYKEKGWRDKVVGWDGVRREGRGDNVGRLGKGNEEEGGKGVKENHGEEAYQVLLGTAKPKEGLPVRVWRVR